MLDLFIKISSIVFKPLFDASKEAITSSSEPKRKMVKSLLELYESVEKVEYYSYKLFQNIETYINPVVMKTLTPAKINKIYKKAIRRNLNELKNAANLMGMKLRDIYDLMNFKHPELLKNLIGLYSLKKHFYDGIVAIPEALYDPENPNDRMLILKPKSEITSITSIYDDRMAAFAFSDPEKIKENYWYKIDLDEDKEKTMEALNNSRASLAQITSIKERLKSFINTNLTMEDFFR
jgi:hypothetical protein